MQARSSTSPEPAQFAVTPVITPTFLAELRRCHLVGAQQGKIHSYFTRPIWVADFVRLLPYLKQKATCDELVWLSITISAREKVANRSAMEKVLLSMALERADSPEQRETIFGLQKPDKVTGQIGLIGSGMAQYS